MRFDDAVAIVTGGATGFGRAFADRILLGGGRVFITDVNGAQLEITGKELANKYGKGQIDWVVQNVLDTDSFHRVFDRAAKYFGSPVNLLVNNAGIAGDLSFWNQDPSRVWEQVIAIDLTALMRGTQVGVQHMKKHLGGKEGVVINLASDAGLHPVANMPEYAAAKHGVVGFTRSCHPLQKQANIRVVALAPGFADTAMGRTAEVTSPKLMAAMGGLIEVRQVVDAFQFAVEDETNPGRIIRITKRGHSYYRFAGDKAIYPDAKL